MPRAMRLFVGTLLSLALAACSHKPETGRTQKIHSGNATRDAQGAELTEDGPDSLVEPPAPGVQPIPTQATVSKAKQVALEQPREAASELHQSDRSDHKAGNFQSAPAKQPEPVEKLVDADGFFPRRRVEFTLLDGKPHGECRAFDPSGRLIGVDRLEHGVLHGLRETYYPSGNKFNEVSFVNGRVEGVCTVWFDGGPVASTIEHVGGRPNGKHVMYFKDGQKMIECERVNGLGQGKRSHYLPDGRLFGITQWIDDQEVGRRLLIQPTSADFQATAERSQRSEILKNYWQ